MIQKVVNKHSLKDSKAAKRDLEYWLSRPPEERLAFWRGFAESCSARSFGHMGAAGQVAWADPESGLSFALLTSGADRDPARQGGRNFRLSTMANECLRG